MDWSSLSCLFLVPVDAAAVPNMSLLLPQTASRFLSIDYRGFNHWTCLCSPLIECYFYKKSKDWVGKTWIGFNRDCLGFLGTWGTGLTYFQSKSQSKKSSTKARIWKRRFTFRNSKWHDSFRSESWMIEVSFRFSRRDRSEVINSTIRMVSPKTDLFSKWTEPRYHIHQRDTAISDGCTPPLDRSIRAWDPIGPLFWMCKLLAVLRGLRSHRSDRELFQTLSLTWLGQSFRLPSTEYKKPYNCLTCWHPGEESHYLCHIFKFERRLSCYLSNYRHWSDRARERKKTIAHAPHSPFTNIIEGKVKAA